MASAFARLPWLILAIVVLASTPARADEKPLIWGADAEGGAPYVFEDPEHPGVERGFEVDLARAIAHELGRPIVRHQYEYVSLLAGLERGDIDLAMNGIEVTPDRAAKVRFSRPYYMNREQLVIRRGDVRCATFASCLAARASIATLGDTAAERMLDARSANKRVYDGQVEPYQDLALGRVDAVLLDLPIAIYYGKRDARLSFGELLPERAHYAIALRKGDETLAREIDRALAHIAESGELMRIDTSWGIFNDDQRELFEPPATALASERGTEAALAAQQGWTFGRYFPLLARGAMLTLLVSGLGMSLAVLLGLPLAACRLWAPRPLSLLAASYVEFFRGIPVLLLLFFLYYGMPTLGVSLDALTASVVAFGLNYAAYEAEVYRAGIQSIPEGQWEAAFALGMSPRTTLCRVVLPQALRVVIPPMTNDFVALLKDTSLVSVVAVVELTKQYQIVAKSSFKYLEIGLVTAALYLALGLPLAHLGRRLERRWARGAL